MPTTGSVHTPPDEAPAEAGAAHDRQPGWERPPPGWSQRLRTALAARRTERPRAALAGVVALALAAAAGIHLVLAPDHAGEDLATGVFFAAVGAGQALAAVLLLLGRARTAVLTTVLLGHAGLIALWAASRHAGLPFGPLPGVTTVAEAPDIAATVLAAVVVVGAGGLLVLRAVLPGRRRTPAPAALGSWGLLAIPAVVALAGWLAVDGPLAHDHSVTANHGLPDPQIDHRPDFLDPHRAPDQPLDAVLFPAGRHPEGVLVTDDTVWVADRVGNAVHRLDPVTGEELAPPVPVGDTPVRMISAEGAIWVTSFSADTVTRLDPDTGEVLSVTPVRRLPYGLAAGAGAVWVANSADSSVTRLDPVTGEQIGDPIEVGFGPTDLVVAEDQVWVVLSLGRRVVRIDPATNTVTGDPIPVAAGSVAITAGHGRLWVPGTTAGVVTVIDPIGRQVEGAVTVDHYPQVGEGPASVAVTDDAVWVANSHDQTVTRIDPETLEVGPARYVGNYHQRRAALTQIAAGPDGALWVSVHEAQAVARMAPASP